MSVNPSAFTTTAGSDAPYFPSTAAYDAYVAAQQAQAAQNALSAYSAQAAIQAANPGSTLTGSTPATNPILASALTSGGGSGIGSSGGGGTPTAGGGPNPGTNLPGGTVGGGSAAGGHALSLGSGGLTMSHIAILLALALGGWYLVANRRGIVRAIK